MDQVCVAVLAWSISASAASIAGLVQLKFGDVIVGTTPSYHRMTGLGGQVNEFGAITATALIPVVGLFVLTRGRDRGLLAAIGVLLIGGLLLSGSLSAVAGLIVGAVVAVALAGRPFLRALAQRRILIGIGAAVVVFGGGLAFAVADGLVTAPWTHLIASTSTGGSTGFAKQQETFWFRVKTLKAGWSTVEAHPVFGAGVNPDALGLIHSSYVHDTLLGAWAGLGFLALVGVVLCLVAPFAAAAGLLRTRLDIRPLVISLTGAAAVFTVYALANPALYRRYCWVPTLLLIALLAQPALMRPRVWAAGGVRSDE